MKEPSSHGDAVGSALEAVRHAINVTLGSTGPNSGTEKAVDFLRVALAGCVKKGERALETAIRDLAEQFSPFGDGTRLLSFSAVETLERFLGRADVLYLLSLRSTKKPPSRAQPLPVASRSSLVDRTSQQRDGVQSYSSATGLGAEIDQDIYAEVLAVFALEAKEQLQLMDTGLRRLDADPADYAAKREVRKRLAAMKGSSALVGVERVRLLSHAAEDLVVEMMGGQTDRTDLALLREIRAALESLAVGDQAERSAISVTELVDRVVERTDEMRAGMPRSADMQPGGLAGEPSTGLPIRSPEPEVGWPFLGEAGEEQVGIEEATLAARERITEALVEGEVGMVTPHPWLPDQVDRLERLVRELEETRVMVERRRSRFEVPIRELRSTAGHLRELSERSRSLGGTLEPRANGESAAGLGRDLNERLTQDLNQTAIALAALDLQLALAASDLDSDLGQMRRLIQRVKEHVGRLDQVSVKTLERRLRRAVSRLAERRGKEVELILEGFDVPLDQELVEVLGSALVHLLKNAVEHGIESPQLRRLRGKSTSGTIRISVTTLGPRLLLKMRDDGAGLDLEGMNVLAVENGITLPTKSSTAEGWSVAMRSGISTLDGREGVGLDLVTALLDRVGGEMSIDSVSHRGTTVKIQMPTDLTLTRGLVVERLGMAVALPSSGVLRVQRADPEGDESLEMGSKAKDYVVFRDDRFEILDLASWLGIEDQVQDSESETGTTVEAPGGRLLGGKTLGGTLLLLEHQGNRRALRVDRVRDAGELAIYPSGPLLERLPGVLGFALGEGEELLPVLDPVAIAGQEQPVIGRARENADGENRQSSPRVLVVDDVASVRRVVGLLLERLGASTILASDGDLALRLLNEESQPPLMALIDLEMPGMNGLELITELRNRGFTFPVYLFTSPSCYLPSVEGLDVEGYVFKPLVRRELGALLRRHYAGVNEDSA